MGTKAKLHFRTVFISDVHLGLAECKIDEANHFIKHIRCEKLVLNGDIIDGWSKKRRGHWTKQHTRFLRLVLKKIEKQGTEVVYVRGNHDAIPHKLLPLRMGSGLTITDEHIHKAADGNRYVIIHGDDFAFNDADMRTYAKERDCTGIISGHIHIHEDKTIGENIRFINLGDWIDTPTALVEHPDGSLELLSYKTFCKRLKAENS